MLVLILLLTVLLTLLLLPLRVQTDIHHGQRRLMRLTVTYAGLTRVWQFESRRTESGSEVTVAGGFIPQREARVIRPGKQHRNAIRKILNELRRCRPARRFLRCHVHTEQLDVQILLHTRAAAATALATGALRVLFSFLTADTLRRTRIRVLPDFLRNHSTWQARCIFSLRPGTLLITAALFFLTKITQGMEREVRSIWNIPSEP